MVKAALVATVIATACSASPGEAPAPEANRRGAGGDAVAYFAGGCFWGVEHFMEQQPGVVGVDSGYMGGHVRAPTYRQVSSGLSGHVEAVRVRYDSTRVSYETLARLFFEIHDPTQKDGQGPDIGAQYLSVVFYGSPEERATATRLVGELKRRGYDVATRLRPTAPFTAAEDNHQDYYARTGKTPYCHRRIRRFGDER